MFELRVMSGLLQLAQLNAEAHPSSKYIYTTTLLVRNILFVDMENKQIIFKGYIDRAPQITDMELKITNISTSQLVETMEDGAVMVKNLYLSCDPYMRGRMRDFHASYIPPFRPDSVPPFLELRLPVFVHCYLLMLCPLITCCYLIHLWISL